MKLQTFILCLAFTIQLLNYSNAIDISGSTSNMNIIQNKQPGSNIFFDRNLTGGSPITNNLPNEIQTTKIMLINPQGEIFNNRGYIGAIRQEAIINSNNLNETSQEMLDKFHTKNSNEIVISNDDDLKNINDLRTKRTKQKPRLTID